ncbi:MAG: hypothetical protein SCH70_07110 [Candidatus Methanoperedens sp.]|nr:hypothetical protein [Candidatus Methanoperedens sp.]
MRSTAQNTIYAPYREDGCEFTPNKPLDCEFNVYLPHRIGKHNIKRIVAKAVSHDPDTLKWIMGFRGAETQYEMLMFYHIRAGTVPRDPIARRYTYVTTEATLKMVNLFHAGKSQKEIAEITGYGKETVRLTLINAKAYIPAKHSRKLTNEMKRKIVSIVESGEKTNASRISKALNVHHYSVERFLKLHMQKFKEREQLKSDVLAAQRHVWYAQKFQGPAEVEVVR